METPQSEYQSRRQKLTLRLDQASRIDRRLWLWRRLAFIAVPVLAALGYEGIVSLWSILIPVLAFIVLMIVHQSARRLRAKIERSIRFYEKGLARLSDQWAGSGTSGDEFLDPQHPYARDLDIFGRGSLFELLCRARTRAGEEKLARWLLSPATAAGIAERQQAIAELRDRLDLREDLDVIGEDLRASLHAEQISAWGRSPSTFTSAILPGIAVIIGLLSLSAILLWFGLGYRTPLLAAILIQSIFLFIHRRRISEVLAAAEQPARDLRLLSAILARIETESFNSPLLVRLRRQLDVEGHPPSRQIAALSRLLEILDSTRNQVFAPFAFVLLIPAQIAFAIDRWKSRSGPLISPWIEAIAEIEALNSLAGFAFENPDHTFPEIVDQEPSFVATALGHPLIPADRCVRNDIALGQTHILIVSGSNMSGKSTMLRSIGINAVLASAGSTVRARHLRLSRLAIGASIQISDSLQSGASRFYAEITRLKQIVELTSAPLPVLFLLDEILSGTNSHDRRIGAEAVIRGLLQRHAIGLTTTHDLALTEIVASLAPLAANVHFQDHLEDGRMLFDYRMHPGIVTHSNAIALMRSVGLEV